MMMIVMAVLRERRGEIDMMGWAHLDGGSRVGVI